MASTISSSLNPVSRSSWISKRVQRLCSQESPRLSIKFYDWYNWPINAFFQHWLRCNGWSRRLTIDTLKRRGAGKNVCCPFAPQFRLISFTRWASFWANQNVFNLPEYRLRLSSLEPRSAATGIQKRVLAKIFCSKWFEKWLLFCVYACMALITCVLVYWEWILFSDVGLNFFPISPH